MFKEINFFAEDYDENPGTGFQIDYDESTDEIRISYFQDYHYKSEAIFKRTDLKLDI